MKRPLLGLVVALSVAAVGCSDVCSRVDSAAEARNDKKRNCSGIPDSNFDPQRCEDNLKSCSDSDKTALDNYAKCRQALPVCDPSTPLSFQAADLGCFQALSNTSAQCATSIGLTF